MEWAHANVCINQYTVAKFYYYRYTRGPRMPCLHVHKNPVDQLFPFEIRFVWDSGVRRSKANPSVRDRDKYVSTAVSVETVLWLGGRPSLWWYKRIWSGVGVFITDFTGATYCKWKWKCRTWVEKAAYLNGVELLDILGRVLVKVLAKVSPSTRVANYSHSTALYLHPVPRHHRHHHHDA